MRFGHRKFFYDRATQELVGASRGDDFPYHCDGSLSGQAGDVADDGCGRCVVCGSPCEALPACPAGMLD